MQGFREAFDLDSKQQIADYEVQEIAVQAGQSTNANVLWPGENATFTFHFANKMNQPLKAGGVIRVVSYRTSVPLGEFWAPHVFKIADLGGEPIQIDLPVGGSQDVTVRPFVPASFGGYALVVDLEGHRRVFAAALVRAVRPEEGRVQFPTYALDTTWDEFMNEGVFELFQKLGVKGMRMGGPYERKSEPGYGKTMARLDQYLQWARKHDVTVMLTLGDGDGWKDQPLGLPRPWLSSDNKMLNTKDDRAWLPEFDDDFQRWVKDIAIQYGWPKGNVNAVELWNEPWEASSISGWGADIPRYREIFTHMAAGVEQARAEAGVKVLIGGTCSSANARDKLFPDGGDQYLKWLDFVSIHYQALAADAAEVPEWVHRASPYGPVRVWDTESWIANSEDRVAGVIASMRAQGQSRTAGIYDGNVYDSRNVKVGDRTYPIVQAWSPAAAVAATQKFIGQRDFRELLFKNGLPWVFVFDGLPSEGSNSPDPEDGTVVIVGDLTQIYEPERVLFRSIIVSADAHMTLSDVGGVISLYDFYGNPVAAKHGKIDIPLNGRGYFLRGNGKAGSFSKLISALQKARLNGYSPVEIVAHDLTKPVEQQPSLRLTLTNVLNHPIRGQLRVKLGGLELARASQEIEVAANQSLVAEVQVVRGQPVPSNIYPLSAEFDAGADGKATHQEDIHVNVIAHRTITVDGDLVDWRGVLPEVLPLSQVGASLTEEAWLPYKDFTKSAVNGMATAYLAYDEDNFYFAAKIADSTPDPGMVRFAVRDDDSYFYPENSVGQDGKELSWPQGVRHYSYRKNFDIPSGTGEHDNVQIAFNVLEKKPWLSHPPGVMPRFITYWDTDYEYALNPVAAEYGGGTEIWRLQVPGMPRKHFFPRQPKSLIDGGAVANGKLAIRRVGDTRIVEASIPWSEMPDVYQKLKADGTIKFTCRVNDNKGPAHELAAWRSVSKDNALTFHDDWQSHWANELEFGVQK